MLRNKISPWRTGTTAAAQTDSTYAPPTPPLMLAELHWEAIFLVRKTTTTDRLSFPDGPAWRVVFCFQKGAHFFPHRWPEIFHTGDDRVLVGLLHLLHDHEQPPPPCPHVCEKGTNRSKRDRTEIDEAKVGGRKKIVCAAETLTRASSRLLLLPRALVYCTCLRWSSDSFPRSCQYIQQLSLLYHRPSVIGPSPNRTVLAAASKTFSTGKRNTLWRSSLQCLTTLTT